MHPFAHLQSTIIALTKIHEQLQKKNSYEQEPPLITICGNFQVGELFFFLLMIMNL